MKLKELQKHTGCSIEEVKASDYPYELIAGDSKAEFPKEFVINVPWHFYQNGIDSCVGTAIACAKSVQEGFKVSARVIWALCKKTDNYTGWGTWISNGLKALIKIGVTKDGYYDETVVGVDREDYMRISMDDKFLESAKPNKASSFWYVKRFEFGKIDINAIKRALFNEKIPLITSMYWFSSYNQPINGFLPKPKGSRSGHAFVIKGWKIDKNGREYLIFQNSWRKTLGKGGDFFIYVDELDSYNLGSCSVLVDIPQDKAYILANYQDKLVKNPNNEKVYYVGGKKIAHIKNEEVFNFGCDNYFWGDWSDIDIIDIEIKHDIII